MNILLIYASNSGGTFLASQIVADTLKRHNHAITVKNVKEVNAADLSPYDLVILASPSWDYQGKEGQPHEDYREFMAKFSAKSLTAKSFAILGLGDSSYTYFCGAVGHLEEFVKNLGGKLIIEPLKIDGFYFDQDKNSKIISDWTDKLATKLV